MELTNLSWHLGAFLFLAWLLWLVIDLKKDTAEVSQCLLPLLLDAAFHSENSHGRFPKSLFVRAARYLLLRELQPVCSPKLRFGKWFSAEKIDTASSSALRALQAIYSMRKVMTGASDPFAQEVFAEVNGALMSVSELCETELARLGARAVVTFDFVHEAQTNLGKWRITFEKIGS